MPDDCAAWHDLVTAAVHEAMPVLEELCSHSGSAPRVVMSGAVISRPGAGPQSFHADGGGGLFNVFIPLVDIEADRDGTQFWPGSHLDESAPDYAPLLTEDTGAMATMVSPGCREGGLLCFDYRCVHRGLANDHRERPVAYVVIAVEDDAQDRVNFPHLSVWEATSEVTAHMPFWDDATGRKVLLARAQRDSSLRKLASSSSMSVTQARDVVRRYCSLHGLDANSLQMQASAASALLMAASNKFTPDLNHNGVCSVAGIGIGPSPGKGLGAFALRSFPTHFTVGEYTGETMTGQQHKNRYSANGTPSAEDEGWALYRRARGVTVSGDYVFKVSDNVFIDAEDPEQSNWTRYINHSSEPNLAVKVLPKGIDGKPRIWFVALRDIKNGEELCFDYGESYWGDNDLFVK